MTIDPKPYYQCGACDAGRPDDCSGWCGVSKKSASRVSQKWAGIAKLQEEMGELQCILGKLSAYPSGEHPDAVYAGPLLKRLQDELGDVLAAVEFFTMMSPEDLKAEDILTRKQMKLKLFLCWERDEGMKGA